MEGVQTLTSSSINSVRLLADPRRSTHIGADANFTGPLISLLTTEIDFDFVDAPSIGAPAPGIEEMFNSPPYFVWNRCYEPREVSKVHDYVRGVQAQRGPYDGVIGFSEGAALAAALLLEDASNIDRRHNPMFRFAIFVNAVNLISPSAKLGKKLSEDEARNMMNAFTGGPSKHRYPALDCVYALCAKTVPALINIPTLHIIGMRDKFRDCSKDLVKLCEGGLATTVRSPAEHEMPRGQALKEMARKLDMMIEAECMAI
jgi:hypothetical protein